jgi:acetamidase/formamidase
VDADLVPDLEVDEGVQLVLETRDALDAYFKANSTVADFAGLPLGAIHPLTGPVSVNGARPGDLLEVEFLDIAPQRCANGTRPRIQDRLGARQPQHGGRSKLT